VWGWTGKPELMADREHVVPTRVGMDRAPLAA